MYYGDQRWDSVMLKVINIKNAARANKPDSYFPQVHQVRDVVSGSLFRLYLERNLSSDYNIIEVHLHYLDWINQHGEEIEEPRR